MQNIEKLNIRIVDTLESNRTLIFEDTQVESPHLIYNGEDGKFANLNTSELHFNLLVKTNDEAVFFHLFTGSEVRFKVILEDVTDAQNPVIHWVGFLLPEQFSEPFVHSNFFVEFVATDGIGSLKNVELSADYYQDKKSVLEVINRCLLKTGLNLPILFAPAINNAGFNLDYLDLEVNTLSYIEDEDDKKPAYDILLAVLESIGCKLFQCQQQWFVIGLNRINDDVILFHKYQNSNILKLEFVEQVTFTRSIIKKVFEASPSITVIPPLKKMTTTWDADVDENLMPEDVVTHLPVNIETDIEDRTPKYWSLQTDKGLTFQVWLLLLPGTSYNDILLNNKYYNGYKAIKSAENLEDNVSGPFVFFHNYQTEVVVTDLETNYATLSDAFYVEGSEDVERFATFSLEFQGYGSGVLSTTELSAYFNLKGDFTTVVNNGAGKARVVSANHGLQTNDVIDLTAIEAYRGYVKVAVVDGNTFDIDKDYTTTSSGSWEISPFKENFKWAITYKKYLTDSASVEEVYLSNFENEDIPDGMFDFDISLDGGNVIGKLTLDKLLLTESGYYNLRLYPVVSHAYLSGLIIYTKCSLELEVDFEKEIVNERNISFTTAHELDVFHSSSEVSNTTRAFSFSDAVASQFTNGTLLDLEVLVTPIFYVKTPYYLGGVLWSTKIVVGLTDEDYFKIKNGYGVYIKKFGTSSIDLLDVGVYSVLDSPADGGKIILQLVFEATSAGFVRVEEEDEIYLKIEEGTSGLIDYPEHWLNKWSRNSVTESISYLEALNRLYLGCLKEYNFRIEGTFLSFLTPFDLVDFKFKGNRRYNPVILDLNLTEGKTEVTLAESKYTDVFFNDEDGGNDDGDSGDDDTNDDLSPAISIAVNVISPSFFNFFWVLHVNYIFTDIAVVNTVVKAKQLTGFGGAYTGFEKTTVITAVSGLAAIGFPLVIGAEAGVYEISIEQGGVFSNFVEVEVAPTVVEPTEYIKIEKVFTGDVFNLTGTYSISYVGFTPTVITEHVQKFDINTQQNIGSAVETVINASLTERSISFLESGSYKVYLVANGKTSNEVAWLSIQT